MIEIRKLIKSRVKLIKRVKIESFRSSLITKQQLMLIMSHLGTWAGPDALKECDAHVLSDFNL